MILNSLKGIILLLAIFFIMENNVFSQTSIKTVNTKAAKKWVANREWANGSALNVHETVDAVEFYKQYHADPALWQKVFTWLKNTNLDTLTKGKYPIDGDKAYASITEAPSKEFDKANWESHKNYIDLQYVIKGKEKIGINPMSTSTLTNPYDEKRDAANYTAEGTYYIASPGTFFLFFPQDVHRPNIKVDGYDLVKKLVIKIHVTP